MMTYSGAFVIVGSDIWHHLVPIASPAAILAFTRSVTVVWVWYERLIISALAKGRNVMERRTVTWRELIAIGLFAGIDIIQAIIDSIYYFRFPFGAGNAATFACQLLSLAGFVAWVLMVGFAWRRDWFFGVLFLLITVASAVGPICDGLLGLMKETNFRFCHKLLPCVICAALYLLTWPARGMGLEGHRYDGTSLYQ
jgi:hypothetical protein